VIVGLGIDVCSIERMKKALERHGDRFFSRICSEKERSDLMGRDIATALAGRFAVKEAFAKALDGARGVGWHEVQVRRAPSGRPLLELSGNAVLAMERVGADAWHVSITHDAGVAVAVVILESRSGAPAPMADRAERPKGTP
jgi:holo-[acyl-carrier protein] synthase